MTTLFLPVSTGPWLTIPAGATNIKFASVAGFAPGQTIRIDTGANQETATIATVGTAGATTAGASTECGRDRYPCRRRDRL